MKVLVDTSVWSLALRRNRAVESPYVLELRELISELRVQMIGPVRQELLSGVRSREQFETLRDHLRAFPDLVLTGGDYERAAEFFNACRQKDVQGSNTDFLICAVAEQHAIPILTTDADFELFREHIPVSLHVPRQKK
jgi:predicted nucleic acid-binding protein